MTDKQAKSTLATLLITCPDQPGLVAALAQLLYGHGANILDSDQHTETTQGVFFQRIRFDTAKIRTDRVTLEHGIAETAERFDMNWELRYAAEKKRLAIMVSKYDHCLYDLLLRHRAGELNCDIPLIISNHPNAKPIAEQFGIDFHVFPISRDTKEEQERQEIALLEQRRVDVVVLARYMQILTGQFVDKFPSRIINIHHSFLPAFVGSKPYHKAYDRGVKLIGATAHYVTRDLDEGPIIEQEVIRTSHRDRVADLVRKGRDVERTTLARAVRWHLDDRVLVCGCKTVVFD